MDLTIQRSTRIEVRGGTIEVIEGRGSPLRLTVGAEPKVIGRHAGCAIVLDDRLVSGMHFEVVAAEYGLRVRDLGSKNGTFEGENRIESLIVASPTTLRCGDCVLQVHPSRPERVPLSRSHRFGQLVGSSPRIRALFDQLQRIAPTDISVLIHGETGTGKELVAEAIHEASARAKHAFVVIDCTNIPAALAESTLFGHEKGAFTGATSRRMSPFLEANKGTVFLDEIGELPLDLQPKLLRALEQRRIKPVGSNRVETVDVRVIAATHRDLAPASNEGRFREDLYFRIARGSVRVPPLRDRPEDIPVLVRHFLGAFGKNDAWGRIPESAFERLARHGWPGNVRELRNLVEVALAYDKGGRIDLAQYLDEMLPPPAMAAAAADTAGLNGTPAPPVDQPYSVWLDAAHRAYFGALHEASTGNLSEMARRSGVHRDTIRTYLHRLGLGKSVRPRR
jgi:DNA-binding NtrC family response regulator